MGQVAVTTYHNDNYRSGANTNETTLTTANVNAQSFGKLLALPVTGAVYAQPLYVPGVNINGTSHNLVFVATEHDQVYAFDANSGAQLWHATFIGAFSFRSILPVSSSDVHCSDLKPEIGITGTPVIDPVTNTMYLVAKTKQVDRLSATPSFFQTLHALDITTGRDKVAPLRIAARVRGTGQGSSGGYLTFDPLWQAQRPGLLLQGGQVFVSWGSHCDLSNFHGWLMSFDEATLAPTGVYVSTADGIGGSFWASGSGPAADSGGSIYFATGNGDFNGNSGGNDFGDSILRLIWSGTGNSITLGDYFTPWDEATLGEDDGDVGSGGVLLLPDQPGTNHPHLLVDAGKEGTIDLVDRDNMGQWQQGNDSQIVQTLPFIIGGVWGAPAFWNNNVYFGGTADNLKAFAFDPVAQQLSTSLTSESPEWFVYPGPSPSVSSSGTSNGIVWIVESDTCCTGNAVLRAYDAGNLATELYNSQQNPGRDQAGLAVKFPVATIADGMVLVGAVNEVDIYGLLDPDGLVGFHCSLLGISAEYCCGQGASGNPCGQLTTQQPTLTSVTR
jgi:hypothetical protein